MVQKRESRLPERVVAKIPVYLNIKIGGVTKTPAGRIVPVKMKHMVFAGPAPTGPHCSYPVHPEFTVENAEGRVTHEIRVFSDDPDANLEVGYLLLGRSGPNLGKVLCRGNGLTAECRGEILPSGDFSVPAPVTKDTPFQPCATPCGKECPAFSAGACKLHALFRFRTPGKTPFGKVDQLRTTGLNSINALKGSMEAILAESGGVLAGLPLRLRIDR